MAIWATFIVSRCCHCAHIVMQLLFTSVAQRIGLICLTTIVAHVRHIGRVVCSVTLLSLHGSLFVNAVLSAIFGMNPSLELLLRRLEMAPHFIRCGISRTHSPLEVSLKFSLHASNHSLLELMVHSQLCSYPLVVWAVIVGKLLQDFCLQNLLICETSIDYSFATPGSGCHEAEKL
jgi:hypothetical protein